MLGCLVFASNAFGTAGTPEQPAYHLQRVFVERVKAVLMKTITVRNTSSGFMKVLALVPPPTETQTLVSCKISCREFPGLNPFSVKDRLTSDKNYSAIKIPLSSDTVNLPLHVDIAYTVDLFKTILRSGSGSGESGAPPADGDSAPSKTIDYDSPKFRKFLADLDLKKRSDESAVYFAYRAFTVLCRELAGRVDSQAPAVDPKDWQASYLCQSTCRNGGCGFCSIQLVGVLRANGIASRLLVGRWALNTQGDYGQFHVRADFWDPQLGWVPVDPTFGMTAIQHGDNPDVHFGGTDGNFITMHMNTEVSPEDTNFYMPFHQFEVVAYEGTARFAPRIEENWTVTKL